MILAEYVSHILWKKIVKKIILVTNKSSATEQLQIVSTNNHCFYNLANVVYKL